MKPLKALKKRKIALVTLKIGSYSTVLVLFLVQKDQIEFISAGTYLYLEVYGSRSK
jgi:hypothetical protein